MRSGPGPGSTAGSRTSAGEPRVRQGLGRGGRWGAGSGRGCRGDHPAWSRVALLSDWVAGWAAARWPRGMLRGRRRGDPAGVANLQAPGWNPGLR
ncbi:hypothetical protein ACFFX0_16745 [Citricoccus parietis]|uniref:Uncharacterized protein n=1 Tax=Citricoccus parietis TaxID=592307 RepID=A0ABV5G1E2_9MICC